MPSLIMAVSIEQGNNWEEIREYSKYLYKKYIILKSIVLYIFRDTIRLLKTLDNLVLKTPLYTLA